jgi:hypothetical protein
MCSCVALAGCSLALTGPKPDRRPSERPDCDTGKGNVVLDGLFGTGFAVGTLAAAADGSTDAGVVLGLLGAAFIASAVRGNTVVDECREAFASYDGLQQAPMPEDRVATRPRIARPVVVAPPPAEEEATVPTAPVAPTVAPPPPPPPPTPPARKPASEWQEFWKEVP